ncbi:hypothetical protein SEA_GUEY18_34 [Gordonia phage Guey18]|nr:hypothetical protein SEA_GUEY18_34 [Gordonia phage Guey18]
MSENDSEVFDAAADILEKDGWSQGKLHQPDGSHCALGALAVASETKVCDETITLNERWPRLYSKLAHYLDSWDIPDWNDYPERTAQEVIDALRGLAKEETKRAEGIANE